MIQPARLENESLAMTQMIDRYKGEKKTIFIADRGYETYNIFAHVKKRNVLSDSCKGWRWGKHDREVLTFLMKMSLTTTCNLY